MSGQIVLSHSSNWKLLTESALQEMQPAEDFHYPWIYLTGNYARVNYIQNKFFVQHPEDSGIIPPVLSWGRFLEKIYEQLDDSRYLLSFTDQLFLIHHVLQQVRDRLNYLALTAAPFSPQVIKRLRSIINALLMINPVEFNGIEKETDVYGMELELIIEEYQKHKENFYLDEADLLSHLLKNVDGEVFPKVRKLFWEIDTPIYPLHLEVIKKFGELGWDIHLLLHYDDHPDFFGNMKSTYSRISEIADEVRKIDDPLGFTGAMYRLNGNGLELDKDLTLVKYADRFGESEEIVKRIKKDIIDYAVPAHRIIVTAPDTAKYLSLLINAFTKHGVPFTVTQSLPLADLLPLQHLQLPLELLHENEELTTLKKLIKSPFYGYYDQLIGIPFEAILNSLRVQYDLSVISNQLQKSINYDESNLSVRPLEFKTDHKRKLLEVLRQIEKDIKPLRSSFSADDFFDFFTTQFDRHNIVPRVIKWKENIPSKNIADILGAVRTFINELDVWRYLMKKSNKEHQFNTSNSLDLFRSVINNSHFQPFEPHQYGVQILPIQFVENIGADKLYILGLTDGSFPRRDTRILSDLPYSISHLFINKQLFDDRRMFLKLMQTSANEIYLSYPEREGEAINVASTLLLELERLTGTEIISAAPVAVFSKSDILARIKNTEHLGEELIHFRRQANITASRNRLEQPLGSYEGNLSKEEIITVYLANLFETREFSASALDIYAKSPIQYFFSRVLYVDESEVFEDWITPMEKGKMVHRVLYRFYAELKEDQRNLENILKIAEEEINRFPFLPSMLWNLQREAFLGSKFGDQKGLFPAFFEYESAQNKSSPLRPAYFEVPFGQITRRITSDLSPGFAQPFEIERDGQQLKLRGIVDRVDMTDDRGIVIVDYKTGASAMFKDLYEGKSFQLPFYLLAITELLKSMESAAYPLGGCYYTIKSETAVEKKVLFSDTRGPALDSKNTFPTTKLGDGLTELTLDDFLERSISFAIKYSQGIRQGKFYHHVDLKICETGGQNCPFEPLCRVNRSKLRYRENLVAN